MCERNVRLVAIWEVSVKDNSWISVVGVDSSVLTIYLNRALHRFHQISQFERNSKWFGRLCHLHRSIVLMPTTLAVPGAKGALVCADAAGANVANNAILMMLGILMNKSPLLAWGLTYRLNDKARGLC
jgi:hypothetical protein